VSCTFIAFVSQNNKSFFRDAIIGPAVVIGSDTVVGKRVTIITSSIGKKCSIGENSVITCSQIGDNVIIEVC
jgi:UDP-3-O-[3-hydroxymyristoyl] glucosamine N-acyltransferase